MLRVRGGSGLGDSIYVRAGVELFLEQGHEVTVCSDYPEVFLGLNVAIEAFRRNNIDRLLHYTLRKKETSTNQWQDVCLQAGLPDKPLKISWPDRQSMMIDAVKKEAAGRPIVLVHGGRIPMGRTDGFGAELLPQRHAFSTVLREFNDCFTVRIGSRADSVYDIDTRADLRDKLSIHDLFSLAQESDGVVAQCSYAVPLAESLGKPGLFVWSSRGLTQERHAYIRQITPQKILSKDSSMFVMDNWSEEQIRYEARDFRFLR